MEPKALEGPVKLDQVESNLVAANRAMKSASICVICGQNFVPFPPVDSHLWCARDLLAKALARDSSEFGVGHPCRFL